LNAFLETRASNRQGHHRRNRDERVEGKLKVPEVGTIFILISWIFSIPLVIEEAPLTSKAGRCFSELIGVS
jgi:hypothetical protein